MANLLAKALDGEEGIHLGAVRPTMIQNELLLKAPMGTAKRRGHPLPQGFFKRFFTGTNQKSCFNKCFPN